MLRSRYHCSLGAGLWFTAASPGSPPRYSPATSCFLPKSWGDTVSSPHPRIALPFNLGPGMAAARPTLGVKDCWNKPWAACSQGHRSDTNGKKGTLLSCKTQMDHRPLDLLCTILDTRGSSGRSLSSFLTLPTCLRAPESTV